MNLKVLTPDHPDIPAVKALYEEAFPANERAMSMDAIVANLDKLPVKLLENRLFSTALPLPERST